MPRLYTPASAWGLRNLLPTQAVPLQFFTHVSDRAYSTRFRALHVLPTGTRSTGTACGGVEDFLSDFLPVPVSFFTSGDVKGFFAPSTVSTGPI